MTRSNKKCKVVKSLFIRKVLPKKTIQYSKHNLFEKPSEGNKYNREFNLFSLKKFTISSMRSNYGLFMNNLIIQRKTDCIVVK